MKVNITTSSGCIIPEGNMTGWGKFFLRREIKEVAGKYGFTLEQVQEAVSPVAVQNSGKDLYVTFYQVNNEKPVMLVEDKKTYWLRITGQVQKTGTFSSANLPQ